MCSAIVMGPGLAPGMHTMMHRTPPPPDVTGGFLLITRSPSLRI